MAAKNQNNEFHNLPADKPVFVEIAEEELGNKLSSAYQNNAKLVSMFVSDDRKFSSSQHAYYIRELSSGLRAYYMLMFPCGKSEIYNYITYTIKLNGNNLVSHAENYPFLTVFEREAADLYGLKLINSPDERTVTNLNTKEIKAYPMLKTYDGEKLSFNENYDYTQITGNDAYILPVGPIHAGIIEAGMFRFAVVGEHVFNVDSRLFYKHRGIEKLFEDTTPEQGVYLAERVSGNSSISHSIAYCSAIESLYDIPLPEKAKYIRTLFAELERVYNLVHNLAHICAGTGLVFGNTYGAKLREHLHQLNEKLTGSRFLFGVNCIGGVKADLSKEILNEIISFFETYEHKINDFIQMLSEDMIHIDRLTNCGRLKNETAQILGARGYAAKASGIPFDMRINKPYLAYGEFVPDIKTSNTGDAKARVEIMESELTDSIHIISKLAAKLIKLSDGTIASGYKIKPDTALVHKIGIGESEGPRGANIYTIILDKNGEKIHRCRINSASMVNWQLVSHAMLGNIVPDFPLVNKSFNLSFSSHDR